MEIRVDSILDGTVKTITKFGAFVALPGGRSGLVHISEISHSYVNEVSDHLKEGQEVRVKVVSIDDAGRINLSIKKTVDPPPPQPRNADRPRNNNYNNNNNRPAPKRNHFEPRPAHASPSRGFSPSKNNTANNAGSDFENMMKDFMQTSDNKLSGMRMQEKRNSRRSGHR